MARMIPKQCDQDTKSSAEKKLFNLLREMEGTDDWTVLHSLAIAKHETQSQGEADFVVIIPSGGVFVLEVKGGRISCNDGMWFSEDYFGKINSIKNPIAEANNAMHSIKDFVKSSSGVEFNRILFGFGIVFPDTTIHGSVRSVEIADEQIADFDDCLSPSGMKSYLLKLAKYWKKRHGTNAVVPTVSLSNELTALLRPHIDGNISLRSLIRNVENQVIELTDNQQDVFETITENERCIIKGGAGTGKTIIALHFANQNADSGQHTGFFCYNKRLSEYLKNNTNMQNGLVCDSFTEYMESVVHESGHNLASATNSSERDKYYKETLPRLFMEAFIELDLTQFDSIILDEAQDLITESYLEAIDLILEGGLKDGKWYFFMDAEKQNLYHSDLNNEDIFDMLQKYNTHYTKCTLKDNCRNSVAIIEKIDAVFGLSTRHKHNDERGADVAVKKYRKTTDQAEILETTLKTLEREGIGFDQIVILSPFRYQNSVCSLVTGTPITSNADERKDAVYFSTIQGFKGLESPVVILTDIETLSDETKMNILYVGMTRAKSALYVLAHNKAVDKLR